MTDTSSAADYRDYLHRYGLKNTRHRQLILQLLLASEGVLTAEDIYQQLCEQGAEINFSTVYRILENFTQKGLTEKSFFGCAQVRLRTACIGAPSPSYLPALPSDCGGRPLPDY